MFIIIIYYIIFGIICALLAHSKGRSVIGWFFIGALTNLIGIILILVLPNLKDAKAKEEAVDMEQRRLREQLRQERLKNDQLRKYTQMRLDTHDDILKVDTRHAQAQLEGGENSADGPFLANEPIGLDDINNQGWYYQQGDNSVGPSSLDLLKQMMREGQIDSSTNVWHESLTQWTAASNVKELDMETQM